MKKVFLFLVLSFFLSSSIAQEAPSGTSEASFIEWNFGVALLNEVIFPGTSVLWGKTFINENDVIYEYEAGFALPTLVTGKIGIWKKFNNTKIVVGIRLWPFNIYGQSSLGTRKRGHWITSVEFNPFYSPSRGFGKKAILNFGYRWNLNISE